MDSEMLEKHFKTFVSEVAMIAAFFYVILLGRVLTFRTKYNKIHAMAYSC